MSPDLRQRTVTAFGATSACDAGTQGPDHAKSGEGNLVAGYDWIHGVGPKIDRPVVFERAWDSIKTNQIGTYEILD